MTVAVLNTDRLVGEYVTERTRGNFPVPLKDVSYDVEIVSGLAVVRQKRTFRNDEGFPIEATMTFPVGYDAVVSSVRATVGGRVLVGVAKARGEARKTYEAALDEGKATVLHEELLRGLHMVSAGNIGPGTEIVVEATYVSPLSVVDGNGRLRIPLTIGAIYGTSPLIPSDDILAGGPAIGAAVRVSGADGITVNGREVTETEVKTSAVIDIVVPSPALPSLKTRMPSGSWAKADFGITGASSRPLEADLLLDTSGSMRSSSPAVSDKWNAVVEGLRAALGACRDDDVFRFWTFSTHCSLRGSARGREAAAALSAVPFDCGGTELAGAVHQVARSGAERNILLVTDGRSHREIDFDIVRESGARFTVVLIGRASFEGRVAHLAAVTGGQMFVVDQGADVAAVVAAALASMRSAATPVRSTSDAEAAVDRVIGGLSVRVSYGKEEPAAGVGCPSLKAFAANLAVQAIPDGVAGPLAESCGIVTRLTSIVMVDSEGGEVDGIAVNRKVALAEPDEVMGFNSLQLMGSSFSAPSPMRAMYSTGGAPLVGVAGGYVETGDGAGAPGWMEGVFPSAAPGPWPMVPDRPRTPLSPSVIRQHPVMAVKGFGGSVDWKSFDWNAAAEAVNGKDVVLRSAEMEWLSDKAARAAVVELATALGKPPLAVAIALAASMFGARDRVAMRIMRKVLSGADNGLVARAAVA